MSDLHLRRYEPRDADAVWGLHERALRDVGVVRRMRVDPAHQRKGYGSAILTELETRAAELEFERLVLDTTPRQTAAMALYESFGYEETHREMTPAGEMVFYEKYLPV